MKRKQVVSLNGMIGRLIYLPEDVYLKLKLKGYSLSALARTLLTNYIQYENMKQTLEKTYKEKEKR